MSPGISDFNVTNSLYNCTSSYVHAANFFMRVMALEPLPSENASSNGGGSFLIVPSATLLKRKSSLEG